MATDTFCVVGAGQAGGWIVKTLRSRGFTGRLVLVGAEGHPPYERPPLSKAALRDADAVSQTVLMSLEALRAAGVEARLDDPVASIDLAKRVVRCESGSEIGYDRLFLTTGALSRRPDWLGPVLSSCVHMLRTLDDAAALREGLAAGGHLLIVGGGWIGLEVAATARALGVGVTVVEAAPRLCARSVPEPVSRWLADLHHRNGVTLHLGRSAQSMVETDGGVTLLLDDGGRIAADRMLVCVGSIPETQLAEAAGLAVSNGVMVDETGRTSDPHVFAAGDVANFPCPFVGGSVRRESWANAQNQAIVAARAALGDDLRYVELPWLWSEQYEHNIQIAGLPEKAATVLFKRGTTVDGGCWLGVDANGMPIGAIGIDSPKLFRPILKALKDSTPIAMDDWGCL
ncbi:FAD-dependent oxidoreductase [Sphingomonas sp.]|uniref:NAD(P)/FAD-dependent oxidoreductase n=1 Tax=Sphingomonas sp. TaxID=28214 RepID=UPI0025DA3E16|nr:FAD-dependent oxidoreductase [Sphingomonas sp.]